MLTFFSTPESNRMQQQAVEEYQRQRVISISPHWRWWEVFERKYDPGRSTPPREPGGARIRLESPAAPGSASRARRRPD